MIKLIPKLVPPRFQLVAGNRHQAWLKFFSIGLLVVATLGIFDASYLAFEHFLGDGVRCFIVEGCDIVTSSSYSLIFGIPVSVAGLLYYLLILSLAILLWQLETKGWWQKLFIVSWLGIMASGYFLYVQALVLNAYCIYCLFSLGFSVLITLFSGLGWKIKSHNF